MQLTDLLVKSKAGDFSATLSLSSFSSNLTPATAQGDEYAPLSVLRKHDEGFYLKTIGLLVIRLNKQFNVARPMNTEQIADLTARIGKKFYYMRLPELMYCFDQAVSGTYGPAYQSLDSETVMSWLEKYDVSTRTDAARTIATGKEEPRPKPLDNVELTALYERVAEGKKTIVSETKRVSDGNTDAQRSARVRYLREKQQGIVKTYSGEELQRALASHTAQEFEYKKDSVERMVDGEYEDVSNESDDE